MRNLNKNRVRPLRAERDGAASEWTGSGPNLDGFSGWSDTDAEQQTDKKKESYGGECVLQNCTHRSQFVTV